MPQVGPTLGVISSLRKVFLSESFYHLPRTLQSIPNASSCGSYCRRAHCHHQHISWRPVPADGCSRGKAIDLNILEGSRPLPSARDNRFLHLLRQKKKKKGWKNPQNPAPSFCLLSYWDQLCIYHQRARPTASLLTLIHILLQKSASQTHLSTACANPHVNHYSANSIARSFGY